MYKTILQLGLLIFCVSIVGFSMSGNSGVFDIVSRAFIVFIASTAIMGLIGYMWVVVEEQRPQHHEKNPVHKSEQ